MSSFTFVGWIDADAIKVLKTHISQGTDELDFGSSDLTIMAKNVQTVRSQIKRSKFKNLGFMVITPESAPMYVLFLGKMCQHVAEPGDNSILSIPLDIVGRYAQYVNLIKNKKIKRTMYPDLYNVFGIPGISGKETRSKSVIDPKLESIEQLTSSTENTDIVRQIKEREKRLGLIDDAEQTIDGADESEIGDPKPRKVARNPPRKNAPKDTKSKNKPDVVSDDETLFGDDKLVESDEDNISQIYPSKQPARKTTASSKSRNPKMVKTTQAEYQESQSTKSSKIEENQEAPEKQEIQELGKLQSPKSGKSKEKQENSETQETQETQEPQESPESQEPQELPESEEPAKKTESPASAKSTTKKPRRKNTEPDDDEWENMF